MKWTIPTVVLLSVGVASADLIHLKDGRVLEGDIRRGDSGWIVTTDGGGRLEIAEDQVARVELRPRTLEGPRGDAVAMSRFQSLKQSLESATDPRVAIDRYRSFIDQYKDTPAAEAARAELEIWSDRQQKGLVRQGQQWVTPERSHELRDEATVLASRARQFVKAGQINEAQPLLAEALAADPDNITALYIDGLLKYRADRLSDARKSLERVLARAADHGPTLNNLAVIAWRQNRTGEALTYYERAMTASPMNQQILSNVAEALNALPKDQQKTAAAQRVYRIFTDQDQRLQAALAAEGIYRWGAQYLTREQYEQVQAKQRELQGQLDAMAQQFAEVEDRIRQLDIQGETNDRTLRQLEAGTYHRAPDGTLIRLPLPPVYYEIQRDNDRLKAQRRQAVQELDRLRAAAAQLQSQMPEPRFTGVQSMIGVEGTPIIPPAVPPQPQPTEQPPQPVRDVTIGPATRPATTAPAE